MNDTEPIIQFESVDVTNSEMIVIEGLDLTINEGEFVFLTGKVGTGKTSIIRTIIGENRATGLKATVAGYDLLNITKRQIPYLRRQMGIVFQDYQLLMDRSIEDNLRFVLRATDWKDAKAIDSRIDEVLNAVGLKSKAHKLPHQLSGGEQQRAAIARALLNEPKILLADEPTGNLDIDTAHDIMDLLTTINREQKTAVLMVTHNKEIIRDYPARVLLCRDNRCTDVSKEPLAFTFSRSGAKSDSFSDKGPTLF